MLPASPTILKTTPIVPPGAPRKKPRHDAIDDQYGTMLGQYEPKKKKPKFDPIGFFASD
jgi:hypothetical protein